MSQLRLHYYSTYILAFRVPSISQLRRNQSTSYTRPGVLVASLKLLCATVDRNVACYTICILYKRIEGTRKQGRRHPRNI